MSGWVWLIIAAVFVVVEITNLALFALFLAVGALAAALGAVAGGNIVAQALVFAVTSVGGVVVARRPLLRAVHGSRTPPLRSGVSALIGQRATVVRAVHGADHPGTVHVRGEDWPAISFDDVAYQPGQVVQVVDIDRTRLVVTIA
jgi:membrane protein implicated in regulation of membrane protease activity